MSKTVVGTFQFPDGTPANGATLYMKLSQDAVAIGTSQIAPRIISIVLNTLGQIPGGINIYANDELTPSGTVYISSVIAVGGGLIYGPELLSISGTSPVNLNSLVPTNVGGIVISYPNPVLQNPSTFQIISGQPLTIASTAALLVQGPMGVTGNTTFSGLTQFLNITSLTVTPAGSGFLRLADTDTIDWRNHANTADLPLGKNTSDQLTWPNTVLMAGAVYTAAAPTTAAAQVSFGSTTATSATTGSNGDVPAQVVGYLIINVAGTNMKVPYYNI